MRPTVYFKAKFGFARAKGIRLIKVITNTFMGWNFSVVPKY